LPEPDLVGKGDLSRDRRAPRRSQSVASRSAMFSICRNQIWWAKAI